MSRQERLAESKREKAKKQCQLLGTMPIGSVLAILLPYHYVIVVLVILLIILLIYTQSKSCRDCKERAKHRPHKVRLIAYSKGMIYLESRYKDEQSFDTPFYSFQYVPNTALETAQQMIDQRFCGIKRAQPRELINYCYIDNEKGESSIIHLFVVEIKDPNQLYIDCKPSEGKWWDVNYLDASYSGKILASQIKEELPCLKETVLLAQSLCKK